MTLPPPSAAVPWFRRVSWPLVVALGTIALSRPVLSITGLADEWGRPATPLIATAVISLVWVSSVVLTRQREPLLTLMLAGLTYGVLSIALSGVLSPILLGTLEGPLTHPAGVAAVLVTNAVWGLLTGLVAMALSSIAPRSPPAADMAASRERSPQVPRMTELVRTNDPGMLSVIEGLLGGADIPYQVADRNMSILEGSITAIQMRILVPDDLEADARELLVDADLGNWLRP